MAPLLVPFLLFLSLLSFSSELIPKAEFLLGKEVPDVVLITSEGRTATLSELADGKPMLLSFIYTRCTSSCPLIVQKLKEALRNIDEGTYKVLLVDFDQRDTVEDLRNFINRRDIGEGWEVVLAKGENLELLSKSLDFKFFYDEKTDMFAHPNLLVVLSPRLRISGYVLGISFKSSKLKELIELAKVDKVALSPLKGILLRCFRYDPVTGTYTLDWSFVVMVFGGLVPITLMFYFVVLKGFIAGLRRETP
ncbi:MAG: SCO family protein [Aquificae bacterium]|nr:SCO family protein [Aquificota bacterium]